MNRLQKASRQLYAVRILRLLKEKRTYEELSEETGIPSGDLNRYVNGYVLPGIDRADRIIQEIGEAFLKTEVQNRVRIDDEGYIDNTKIVFDQSLLDVLAVIIADSDNFSSPDVILTAATDGITLASAFARYFDAKCAYAKQSKETAVEDFIEARERFDSGIELTYYLPTNLLTTSDNVLIVDDLIRSGETQEILLEIVDISGATVIGVFALIAAGDQGLERARQRTDAPVTSFIQV
ncbi:MAG: phosphoribosyltransferase family protein [Halobacteriaceae archaeon]